MSQKTLVVEDNEINRELVCDWLEVEGHAVESAASLPEAFEALARQLPGVVLLDINLGPDDGVCLVQWMRQQPGISGIPVIALTAHAMAEERERIMKAGCNACLSKPIDFQMLREELARWLRYP